MYHIVYKTTNLINEKIYIGVHSTKDLDDGYFGSGKVLTRAICKYGIENFKREVLELFESNEEAYEKEAKLVDDDFINRKDTYNIATGGKGGFSTEVKKLGGIASAKKFWSTPGMHERHSKIINERNKKLHKLGKFPYSTRNWTGKRHSEESKKKIGEANSKSQKGKLNSQYGKMWIFNEKKKESIKIIQEEFEAYKSKGWLKGRKIKW